MEIPELDEPLLTAAEEIDLARAIEAGVLAQALLAGWPSTVSVRPEELRQLVELGRRARERFLRANLRLVAQVALRAARNTEVPLGELFQEGALSLVEALDRFDHRQGARFATYALPWIRSFVQRVVQTRCGGVYLGRSAAERRTRLKAVQRELFHELGSEPGLELLAQRLGWTPTAVRELLRHENTSGLEDGHGNVIQLEDRRAQHDLELVLERVTGGPAWMNHLSQLERQVICLRFGFVRAPATQRQVAQRLGISPARVRSVEHRALARLRAAGRGVLAAA